MVLSDDYNPKCAKFRIENLWSDFKNPGEWYWDREAELVYYIPKSGEKIGKVEIEVPLLFQLILIEGRPGAPLTGISFQGIEFFGTETLPPQDYMSWSEPYSMSGSKRLRDSSRFFIERHNALYQTGELYGVSPQGAYELPGVIHARHVENLMIQNCEFRGLGVYAVVLEEGCWRCSVLDSEFHELAAGAIQMDGGDHRRGIEWQNGQHTISRNHISRIGVIYSAGIGVLSMFSSQNRIEENHIHHTGYTGISCGWMWGVDPQPVWGNVIARNDIHDVGTHGGLSDMGAIYLLGLQPGTYVRENVVRDIYSSTYGACAIYLDEGASLIEVEGNFIKGRFDLGIHLHKTRANTIRRNVIAGDRLRGGLVINGTLDHDRDVLYPPLELIVQRNVFVTPQNIPAIADPQGRSEMEKGFECDLNLYLTWEKKPGMIYQGKTKGGYQRAGGSQLKFKEWQKKGFDLHGAECLRHEVKVVKNKIVGLKKVIAQKAIKGKSDF